jgi:hypothetical protein
MILIWTILIIISALSLWWIVYSCLKNADNFVFSVGIGMVVLFVGWILVGYSISIEMSETKIKGVEVTKSRNFIIVTDNKKYYLFNKKVDFDNITDTTTFYINQGVNMYGIDCNYKEVFYYSYQDTIQTLDSISIREMKIKTLGVKL